MNIMEIAECMADRCHKVVGCDIECPFGSKSCVEVKAEEWLYIMATAELPELESVKPARVCGTCCYYMENNICEIRPEKVDENCNVCAMWK